ncbi:ATPase, T2SS/T4P/T4SS family [Vallitalea okinawensis]|uniref:ATPase, T2SS/T4P/T4SS family n=1 Tax=Vallitalea okinawensis TaxID=2078660 RepID=UPI000CFC9666|nr:ATPase, T2SS/T4P/T4SS family [Vallitalea okinawensis]
MMNLEGFLSTTEIQMVRKCVELRFEDHRKFKTPEALIIYEQRLLEPDILFQCTSQAYSVNLHLPSARYVPQEIVEHFYTYKCLPLSKDPVNHTILIGILPEWDIESIIPFKDWNIEKVYVPLHYYIKHYTRLYGIPEFLYRIPVKDQFDFIVEEAVSLEANEITLSSRASSIDINYQIKSKRVKAKRNLTLDDIQELIKLICAKAGSPMVNGDVNQGKMRCIQLDLHHRGRVVINDNHHCQIITIRIIPSMFIIEHLQELSMDKRSIDFIRENFLDSEPGIRLVMGPPCSGKSTTILTIFKELLAKEKCNIISLEHPVESLVDNMHQMNIDHDEDWMDGFEALKNQNPDRLYISEVTSFTAKAIMDLSCSGQVVYSTINAHCLSEGLLHLQELSDYSIDRVIMNMHSIVTQKLITNIAGDLNPLIKCLYFSPELKTKLMGKTIGEIYTALKEEEEKWSWTDMPT